MTIDFKKSVESAKTEIAKIEFEEPEKEMLALLAGYNLATAKVIGDDIFGAISPRSTKELSWLIEAAKCMNFAINEKDLREGVTLNDLDDKLIKIYNKAIVLLCWIDIMMDDLAENITNEEEAGIAFMLFEDAQEYFEKRVNKDTETGQIGSGKLAEYGEILKRYLDEFFHTLNQLPGLHDPAKTMIIEGFNELVESLMFSGTYRLQMASTPNETIELYTSIGEHNEAKEDGESSIDIYMSQNSGNMAMQIMFGMFSTLLKEESAKVLIDASRNFSPVGRIGNDCATGMNEMEKGQMNGVMYWARENKVLTSDELTKLNNGDIKASSITEKLIRGRVYEKMLQSRRKKLKKLTESKNLQHVLDKEEVEANMERLLKLELSRVTFL